MFSVDDMCSYNRGQKLLGKLRPSLHFAPNSLFELLPVLFGKCHALVPPPPPHIQCWDCSWGFSCKISHHIVPEKSNIEKGEGVISKVMLPSQHFCPGL